MTYYNEEGLFVPHRVDHKAWFDRLAMFEDGDDRNYAPQEGIAKLKDTIKDKTVCDLGCNNGKTAIALRQHASKVYGIEIDSTLAAEAEEKGVIVTEGDINSVSFPECDYYYVWFGNTDTVKSWIEKVKAQYPSAKFIIHHCLTLDNEKDYYDTVGGDKITYTAEGCDWGFSIV